MSSEKTIMEHVFIPIAVLTTPKDGTVRTRRWWICNPEQEAVLFVKMRYGSLMPQCNRDERVSEKLRSRLYPDLKLVYIETAFLGPFGDCT